ncbi:MAG: hypothetical protein RLZ25_1312 [Pseudomonadota bacterium]|jgi:hypothetical protein
MFKKIPLKVLILGISIGSSSALAAEPADNVHEMIYKTCRELHGNLNQQETLMGPLIESAAEIYRVDLKTPGTIQNIAWLIRTGCSVWPDAYASAISAKAVRALGENRKPTPTKLFPHADRALTDCDQFDQQTPAERKAVTDMIDGYVTAHYKARLPNYWNDEYLTNSVHNACQIAPGSYVFEIIGQLVRTSGKNGADSPH